MTRPCYHCHRNEASERSAFCEPCRGSNRPMFYPTDRRQRSAFTRLLLLGATVTTAWLIYKTAEFALK